MNQPGNKVREWTLGCLENAAPDGGDPTMAQARFFGIVSAKQAVTFNEGIKGIEVIERSAYDALLALTIGMAAVLEHAIDLEYFAQGGSTEAWAKDELAKFNKLKETL